jgi:hypothetical protein
MPSLPPRGAAPLGNSSGAGSARRAGLSPAPCRRRVDGRVSAAPGPAMCEARFLHFSLPLDRRCERRVATQVRLDRFVGFASSR